MWATWAQSRWVKRVLNVLQIRASLKLSAILSVLLTILLTALFTN
jgi:hypothetical protein